VAVVENCGFMKREVIKLKICPKCNTGNNDNDIQCKDCGYSLSDTIIEKHRNYLEEITERDEKRHRLKMRIHNIVLLIIGGFYIYFYIKALSKVGFIELTFIAVLFPILSYMGIHHPRTMFVISHIFTIENIDNVELSDWYLISSKIGGYICAIVGFVFMAIFATKM
jgi:ribosomal protein L40E